MSAHEKGLEAAVAAFEEKFPGRGEQWRGACMTAIDAYLAALDTGEAAACPDCDGTGLKNGREDEPCLHCAGEGTDPDFEGNPSKRFNPEWDGNRWRIAWSPGGYAVPYEHHAATIAALRALIAETEDAMNRWHNRAKEEHDRAEAAEAKLAKAVDRLEDAAQRMEAMVPVLRAEKFDETIVGVCRYGAEYARTTLASIKESENG